MKKVCFLIITTVFFLFSCTKQKTQPQLTKSQVKGVIDSIMVVKTREIEAEGKRDLQYRLKIEVKIKADSIINAQEKAAK